MVSEPREKKNPNYFRFIRESIMGNLSVTVFHSGHPSHLLKLSDQPYRHQKTLTAGDLFRRSPFPTPTIPSGAQGGDLQLFSKHWRKNPSHACLFSGGLNLKRRHVRARGALSGHAFPPPASPDASASVELWFMGQGYEDHLVTQEADISEVDRVQWRKIDAQLKRLYTNDIQRLYKVASSIVNVRQQDMDLSTYIGQIASLKEEFLTMMPLTTDVRDQRTQIDKFFMVLTFIGLRPDLETLHGRPPRTAHVAQSFDPQSPQPPNSATSQGISLTDNSGASDHISGNKDLFSSITTTSALPTVTLANGSQTIAKGFGFTHPLPSLPLHSVLYAPECPFNLISISKITRTLNCSITFSDKFVTLQDQSTGKTIGIGLESQGLYHLTAPSTPAICISTDAPLLIHSRLGHPSLSKFQKMVPSFSSLSSLACESCQLGKHTRVSFPKRLNNRTKSPFELVHTDVWGPCRTASTLGFQYFVTFIDDYSRCTWTNFLPESQNASSWDIPDFKRVIVVIPLRLIATFSPLMSLSLRTHLPSRPLQVYHRCHRVAIPPSLAEVPADSLPIPSASPTLPLPPSADLPIALRKGNRSTRNPHLIYNFLSYHRLSSPYSAFVSVISSVSLPKSTPQALSHLGWRQAMVDEMTALHSNGTWDLVVLPSGKSTVGCRWVYTVKVNPDGQVDHPKARLVAKGYTQVYGSDYGDTFSPIAEITSVRLLLSMAAMRFWPLYQLDIKNVFLHGDLAEKAYMEQPPGFVAQGEFGLVCRLCRSLYGLKQSPRAWFSRFSSTKDLGKLKYFLGIEITQSSSGVVLSQRKYTLDILEETGMLDCKPVDTPMDPNVKLISGQGEPLGDPGRYRRLVGKLNYLTITRPDISFPVSVVSQFLQSPCDSHWDVVIRILRYIKSTPGQGVLYENRGHSQVVGYTDADWAGSPTDRRSTSGYCVFIGGNLISWKSKKQDVVARSSAEAEYRAMALATCELIWLKHLLRELRFGKDEQMKLICDNQAALHIACNPVFHERTKHIEVDCHFIREKIASGCVATSFVNSNDQLADIFTKSLRGPRIKYICNKLSAYNIYAPA
ncbi:Retrovirus-related Pol polyprotein from transposon RE2 [Vitis vinifera]|uniref:Retrovirus-related Pol polyprotein from transposon RE2 n=1 Tax=Vitis vinifera TaxID=29760 RepID=A0A438GX53_VITVI|nr:Retrovirus-related Pol polyprotein from transposon RE2 [Vitis vinifera]